MSPSQRRFGEVYCPLTTQSLQKTLSDIDLISLFGQKKPLGEKRLAQGMTDVDPFTIEEREDIIAGVRRYAPLYVNYVICGFWTGWRPNEACA
jgi:hypothetical protein